MHTSRRFTLTAAALALAALSSGALAQPAQRPIRIGVLSDMNGMTSDIVGAGSVIAARMAVEDAGSRVGERPVEVVSGDHQNKPDVASLTARRWYDVEGVDAIVDLPNSSVALAVQEVTRQANKVVMHTAGASSALTGKACSPNGVHWSRDSYGLAQSIGSAVVKSGGDSWFFVTADYAFGHATEAAVSEVVKQSGGRVVGGVRHPTGTSDFSSFLLQAQASKAKIVAMANAGNDTIQALKQATEYGLAGGGQRVVATYINLSEIHALGLQAARGTQIVDTAYWDMNPAMRAWSQRFFERHRRMPTSLQADVYAAVQHYLKAAAGADPADGAAMVRRMKAMPIAGPVLADGRIREDGRVIRDYYMFRVKSPEESKGPWDYLTLEQTIPGASLVLPLAQSECPLVRK